MKIVIFGAGSIGCYVGGKLSVHNPDVTFLGRERIQKVIQTNGLTLSHYELPEVKIKAEDINYTTDLGCLREADLILLCVKSQDTLTAILQIKQEANPKTTVVSLQNGVQNPDLLKIHLPGWKTACGMVPYNVINKGNGHFHCGTEGELVFERSYETGLLAQQCKQAGLPTLQSDNISGVLWGKLLLNLNNALNVLSGRPLKEQLANKTYRLILATCIEEAMSVLKVANIKPEKIGKTKPQQMLKILRLPNFLFTPVANTRIKIDPLARSSMWEDLQAGRGSEIDYINGAIIKLAKTHKKKAPVNQRVVELVKEAFAHGKSPAYSGEELLELLPIKK
ncbi:MAG: 2-dehydropantoate 2-reductase [Gammaproteobacteria bacterium]|nr:2-dehydropantoate 2-reductase [Gammaproteobacteria bacterium]